MSGNPVLNDRRFVTIANSDTSTGSMTIEGAIQKSLTLFGVLIFGVLLCMSAFMGAEVSAPGSGYALAALGTLIGGLGGFAVVIMLVFVRPKGTPVKTMGAYVVFQSLFLSGFTFMMERAYPGIATQAGLVTVGITGSMVALYTSRAVRVGPRFNMMVGALVMTVMFVYVAQLLLWLITGMSIPLIHGSGIIGIAFSGVIVFIASLTLLSDFHFIEEGARYGYPKHMEWWAAFGLLMSVVWIYVEVLRLIAKLRDH
jgi:uncharacterized YccA/Bax inhibitor family protein